MIKIELTSEEKARARAQELVDWYIQRLENDKGTHRQWREGDWKDATKQEEG